MIVPKKVHVFNVNLAKLTGSNSSPSIVDLVRKPSIVQGKPSVDLYGDHSTGVKIWLEILHGKQSTAADLKNISIEDVWYMLHTALKHGFDPKRDDPKKWFNSWYLEHSAQQLGVYDYQQLLFPLFTFDHAHGFAAATKFLAYNGAGHITEKRPEDFRHENLRLEQRIIRESALSFPFACTVRMLMCSEHLEQINAAKGRLRIVLERNLYKQTIAFLVAGCEHKAERNFAWADALHDTRVMPLGNVQHLGINAIIKKLEEIEEPDEDTVPSCFKCGGDFLTIVHGATGDVEQLFDGLCLDCMEKSKFDNRDTDYWKHADRHIDWDRGCRVKHDQPTWYFSFMGRKEKQIEWAKRRREDRNAGRGNDSD